MGGGVKGWLASGRREGGGRELVEEQSTQQPRTQTPPALKTGRGESAKVGWEPRYGGLESNSSSHNGSSSGLLGQPAQATRQQHRWVIFLVRPAQTLLHQTKSLWNTKHEAIDWGIPGSNHGAEKHHWNHRDVAQTESKQPHRAAGRQAASQVGNLAGWQTTKLTGRQQGR